MSEKKSEDENVEVEGHVYDGIVEYDNPMPRWWVNLFWATIFFSLGYSVYYMGGYGPGSLDEYATEMQRAAEEIEKRKGETATSGTEEDLGSRLLVAARNQEMIVKGKDLFATRCMACHADKGQGLIGPNLTDNNWIHGGSLEQILHIINVGVVEKGMIPWEAQLSEEERFALVAFIRSIQGTNVEGKAPEGEISEATSLQ